MNAPLPDDASILLRSSIGSHVSKMVRILQEEAQKTGPEGIAGECLEFVLDHNVVEVFFILGRDDVRACCETEPTWRLSPHAHPACTQ